jgi:hypothetical protein
MVLALQLLVSTAAHAASGTWGIGGYPYVAGKVCTTTDVSGNTTTTPLAAWDLGGGSLATRAGAATLGYLTTALTSSGAADSGAPPLASVAAQSVTTVNAGADGFNSAGEIAIYARLLSTTDPDDSTAARIAQAVLARTTPNGQVQPPTCGGDTSALLSAAAALAGPYKLTLTSPEAGIDPGSTGNVIATVLSARGNPVPDMPVSYAGTDGTTTTATTDAQGHAKLTVTVPLQVTTPTVPITASINAVIGLSQVSAIATATAANPTGTVASALTPAPPVEVTAQGSVPVSQTANPVISAAGGHTGLALGSALTPQAVITGLHGHSANVSFTIYGPLALTAKQACVAAKFTAKSPVAAGTAPVTVTGDQTLKASSWAPTATGCYVVRATLTTTNANPAATAESSLSDPAAIVEVINPVAALSPAQNVVGAGPQQASINLSGTHDNAGTVAATLVGPVSPGTDGSCNGVTFDHAPTAASATVAVSADGNQTLKSTQLARAGCYFWKGTLTLNLGGGPSGAVQVPIQAPSNGILLLTPTVDLAIDQSSTASPAAVSSTVTVTGLSGQAAHVALEMHYTPAGAYGCRDASWDGTSVSQTGPSTVIAAPDGVTSVVASTGQLRSLGCWYPVAVLTVDANPAIAVRTGLSDSDAVISAAVDLSTSQTIVSGPTRHGSSWLPVFIAGGVVAGLEIILSVVVLLIARRSAKRPVRDSPQLADELITISRDESRSE